MSPQREIEIKLEVSDPRAFKQRLKKLGFRRISPRRFEQNWLFDFRDSSLRHRQCALRLRLAGGQGSITFKGVRSGPARFKVRDEIETKVADARQARKILQSLGLREVFRYKKYRTLYAAQPPSGILAFDETPVGDFIELEGPGRWIDSTARTLGYWRSDYITASYPALYSVRRNKARVEGCS